MLTKGAIGNLINRYKAVLTKCNLINVFGSLAVATMLVAGSAGMALAEDGELAPMYPTPEGEDVWYEIKLGDYVVVYEYCCQDADVYICSYQIQYISDDCVHGVPVNL